MEESKREKSRIGWEDYSRWKKSSYYTYVQGLWVDYTEDNQGITFEEFVRNHNHWKSLETAKSLIEIWEAEKNNRR